MAYDITNSILDQLIILFTQDMVTNVTATGDAYRLVTVERTPLQDDPTTTAPFILVGIAKDPSRILDPLHDNEMGAGLKWMNFFTVAGRSDQKLSKSEAYTAAGVLQQRALRVLIQHTHLDNLVSEQGESVFGCAFNLVDEVSLSVFGGETEWFGEFLIKLHIFSQESYSMLTGV